MVPERRTKGFVKQVSFKSGVNRESEDGDCDEVMYALQGGVNRGRVNMMSL